MSAETEFLEAFSAAAHDVDLEERGFTIFHFFDSDFVGRLIFGYRDDLNHELVLKSGRREIASAAGRKLLMGALVGQQIGAPARTRVLLPHLHEVRMQVEHSKVGDDSSRRDQIMAALGMRNLLHALSEQMSQGDADEILGVFLEHGPKIFYGVDLLSGSWQSRLGRMLTIGINKGSPFEGGGQVVVGPEFARVSRFVAHPGGAARRSMATASVKDAMALSTLALAVRAAESASEPYPIVRFYTETARIHRAWREHAEFRRLLTYHVGGGAPSDMHSSVHHVLRSTYYYLIRALIPDLSYRKTDASKPVTKADQKSSPIYTMCQDLASAARELRTGGVHEGDLASFPVAGRTLGHYMAEVTDLSAYSTAWRQLMSTVPKGLPGELVRDLRTVIRGENEHARGIEASFRRQVEVLSSQTSEIAAFGDAYLHTLAAMDRVKGSLRPAYGGLFAHFGLVRWGFRPSPEAEQMLRRLVEGYEALDRDYGSDGHLRVEGPSALVIELTQRLLEMRASDSGGVSELNESVAVLSFFALIRDYHTVVRQGRRLLGGMALQRGGTSTSGAVAEVERELVAGALENMVAAAEVRREIQALFAQENWADGMLALRVRAMSLVESLEASNRKFPTQPEAIAVAQAYMLFHVWTAFNRSAMTLGLNGPPRRVKHPDLAEQSFDLCWNALVWCEPNRPAYPLLLNHCIYVGSLGRLWTGVDLNDKLVRLVREFLGYGALAESLWSYRFDDTLGFYYYARAAERLEGLIANGHADEAGWLRCALDLDESRKWFARLPPDTSDDEIIAHRSLLYELEVDLERRTSGSR